MIDKVQKIRKEVARIQLYTQSEVLKQVLDYIDEVQKELVSEDLEEAAKRYSDNEDPICTCEECLLKSFKAGAKWQKEQFEKERLKHCDALTAEQVQIESDFVVNHLKKHNRIPTFIDAIEYGMRLQEKQMMAKAIDGKVIANGMGNPILHLWDKGRHLVGKKVKVVVIEKD